MKLPMNAYEWAIRHIKLEGDTDIFPVPFEVDAVWQKRTEMKRLLANIDVSSYTWKGGRRFVTPKGELAFRTATQLDPVDSIVLSAIIKKYGHKLEAKRMPQDVVFSHRFSPTNDGRMYGTDSRWKPFWQSCISASNSENVSHVLRIDIADYYNQIYHHVLENEMLDSGIPKPISKAIIGMAATYTDKVSRGIPVGPHSTHILAEVAFDPIDRAIASEGMTFKRYVDDIFIFCESEDEALICLHKLAGIIDGQQRLTLQNHKTEIFTADYFSNEAGRFLINRPLNQNEARILEALSEISDSDYDFFSLEDIEDGDLHLFEHDVLHDLIESYLQEDPVPYDRIGWLLRRLSKGGIPGGFRTVLQNIDRLQPVLGGAIQYLRAAGQNCGATYLLNSADYIFDALDLDLIRSSDYASMSLLSLFSRIPDLNHADQLTEIYGSLGNESQREVVLAAVEARSAAWLKNKKGEFRQAAPWMRRALLRMAVCLAGDEGPIWLRSLRQNLTPLEKCIVAAITQQPIPRDTSFG